MPVTLNSNEELLMNVIMTFEKSKLTYLDEYNSFTNLSTQFLSEYKFSKDDIKDLYKFKIDELEYELTKKQMNYSYDFSIGLKSFINVLYDRLQDDIPAYLNFTGSKRQDMVPLEAYDYVGHNKELKFF